MGINTIDGDEYHWADNKIFRKVKVFKKVYTQSTLKVNKSIL